MGEVYLLNSSRDTERNLNWVTILDTLLERKADVLLLSTCTSHREARATKLKFSDTLDELISHGSTVKESATFPFSSDWVIETSYLDVRVLSHAAVSRVHYRPGRLRQVIHIVPVWADVEPREPSPPPLPMRQAFVPELYREDDLSEVQWWQLLEQLKDDLPLGPSHRTISLLLQYFAKAHEVLFGVVNDSDALIVDKAIDAETREELRDIWYDFVRLVPAEPAVKTLLKHYSSGAMASDHAAESLLKLGRSNFRRLGLPLARNIDIVLMAGLRLEGVDMLNKAAEGQVLSGLGLATFAKLQKLLVPAPGTTFLTLRLPQGDMRNAGKPTDHVSALIPRSISGLGTVLVEYKQHVQGDAGDEQRTKIAAFRVEALARALELPKSSEFRTLKCLGWFDEPNLHRYGLASAFPEGVSGEFMSMHDMMTHPRPQTNAGLGQCFAIALAIGEALQRWHVAGWLHRALSSRNIVFFFSADGTEVLWDKPYICGFEYARPDAAPWVGRFVEDFATNVYNHPERQGEPTEQHGKIHDMYSFGVVMCEIALWSTIEHVFDTVDKRTLSPMRMQQMILKYAEESVGYHMGNKYLRSAVTCLKGSFGVGYDDAFGTKLLKAFDKLVLRNLEDGLKVD